MTLRNRESSNFQGFPQCWSSSRRGRIPATTPVNAYQVDDHRERQEVPPNTPGILIMNSLMNSDSLEDKDQRPHPDIIKKAAADGVLLMRTLDLLRYASAVEDGSLT